MECGAEECLSAEAWVAGLPPLSKASGGLLCKLPVESCCKLRFQSHRGKRGHEDLAPSPSQFFSSRGPFL